MSTFIKSLGFDRAISVSSNSCTDSEALILQQVQSFSIDNVYFNKDESGHSFPAVFLKQVEQFNVDTLKEIASIQQKVWNYKKVIFLYVYSDTEIRIYNCAEKPIFKANNTNYESELEKLEIKRASFSDEKRLQQLSELFSRIAIDTGIIWTLDKAQEIRKKVNLQKRVDSYLVSSLKVTAKKLAKSGLNREFVNTLIFRSLFLLYLEDRGATDKSFYTQIKESASSYFDILEDVAATYTLYEQLENHFNGNVFTLQPNEKVTKEQLQLIKKCFISGDEDTSQIDLFSEWRLFDFSIIQIELLSEIYEQFLTQTNPEYKKSSGTYYTPPSLVEFILNEKLPIAKAHTDYTLKILDPSCGSGIFLVESFKRLVKRYENHHGKKLNDFDKLKELLLNNIFGFEIEPESIKVTTFSLYLALVDQLDPKTIWSKENHHLPYLINNPNDETLKQQGSNLFCLDTIEDSTEFKSFQFDLIIGNPPFGTKNLLPSIRDYCEQYSFAKEMVLPFLHKATRLTSEKGQIALIFNTKVLTNTGSTYQNFRQWLFNECYVEKVFNFSILRKVPKGYGGQLFGDAVGPISIVYYQNTVPDNSSNRIEYIAPKTYVKSNVIEGLQIDSSDVKYLPRSECQKPDSKIWKVAMWGGMSDWELIDRITTKYKQSIGDVIKNNEKFHCGSGLHAPSLSQKKKGHVFQPDIVIDIKQVERFYTKNDALLSSNKIFRKINERIFTPPYILIKEGGKDKELCTSYIDYQSYHTGAYSISVVDKKDTSILKLLCSLLNSNFAKYFLSLTSASWGIERERMQANESLSLPFPDKFIHNSKNIIELTKKFDALSTKIRNEAVLKNNDTYALECDINHIISSNILQLSELDKWIIDDFINFSASLLEEKQDSKALKQTPSNEVEEYAHIISDRMNGFIEGQGLYINTTTYNMTSFSPLTMIKLSFENTNEKNKLSNVDILSELKKLDQYLWEQSANNIFVRKNLNYKTGSDIYIIRPNQRRFWSKSKAVDDAFDLTLEILAGE